MLFSSILLGFTQENRKEEQSLKIWHKIQMLHTNSNVAKIKIALEYTRNVWRGDNH